MNIFEEFPNNSNVFSWENKKIFYSYVSCETREFDLYDSRIACLNILFRNGDKNLLTPALFGIFFDWGFCMEKSPVDLLAEERIDTGSPSFASNTGWWWTTTRPRDGMKSKCCFESSLAVIESSSVMVGSTQLTDTN